MVVRMQFLRFSPEHISEVKRLFSEELLPALQQVRGIRNARLLEPADPSDAFIAITEWETGEDAGTFEESALCEQHCKITRRFTVKESPVKTYRFEPVHTDVPVMVG